MQKGEKILPMNF